MAMPLMLVTAATFATPSATFADMPFTLFASFLRLISLSPALRLSLFYAAMPFSDTPPRTMISYATRFRLPL